MPTLGRASTTSLAFSEFSRRIAARKARSLTRPAAAPSANSLRGAEAPAIDPVSPTLGRVLNGESGMRSIRVMCSWLDRR
jgi:hypothetical protein